MQLAISLLRSCYDVLRLDTTKEVGEEFCASSSPTSFCLKRIKMGRLEYFLKGPVRLTHAKGLRILLGTSCIRSLKRELKLDGPRLYSSIEHWPFDDPQFINNASSHLSL